MTLSTHTDNGPIIVEHEEPCYDCNHSDCRVIFSKNDLYFFERSTRCNFESSQLRSDIEPAKEVICD